MIFVGNVRGNGQELARHLTSSENEHVTIHEISGFASDDLSGSFKEAKAIARGTKCKKYLYSMSLNPPANETASTELFLETISRAEETLGLEGQSRAVVFHEKGGRRHCHAVWSRIDSEAMKAVAISFPKRKLMELSKEIYLEQEWDMPKGFIQPHLRDLSNFTLAQWQQAKRIGQDARELGQAFRSCWQSSDGRESFSNALHEYGLSLARGDRRGFVATGLNGEVYAIPKWVGAKAKDVRAKLGDPQELLSLEQARVELAQRVSPVVERLNKKHESQHKELSRRQEKMLWQLTEKHILERDMLHKRQERQTSKETTLRQERFNRGLRGLFDRLTGAYSKTKRQNESEAFEAAKRDQRERDSQIFKHISEKRDFTRKSQGLIEKSLRVRASLNRDLAKLHSDREAPNGKGPEFDR